MNNKVQTGPKIQFGGLNIGLLSVLYQESIEGVVTIDPKQAVKKHKAKDKSHFIFFMFLI